ncbi:MAG: uncharacterized protein KVP18_002715 [Porospora cf. gigantea A]|uniref:uncharacterized protein n=1 Tax=Porospora cf. gigantea A TaxID=2853593 RepID=UPI0035598112|nr:MAG: hypothetical protein KVP18_002715 [Porospora cf. gigantea A]
MSVRQCILVVQQRARRSAVFVVEDEPLFNDLAGRMPQMNVLYQSVAEGQYRQLSGPRRRFVAVEGYLKGRRTIMLLVLHAADLDEVVRVGLASALRVTVNDGRGNPDLFASDFYSTLHVRRSPEVSDVVLEWFAAMANRAVAQDAGIVPMDARELQRATQRLKSLSIADAEGRSVEDTHTLVAESLRLLDVTVSRLFCREQRMEADLRELTSLSKELTDQVAHIWMLLRSQGRDQLDLDLLHSLVSDEYTSTMRKMTTAVKNQVHHLHSVRKLLGQLAQEPTAPPQRSGSPMECVININPPEDSADPDNHSSSTSRRSRSSFESRRSSSSSIKFTFERRVFPGSGDSVATADVPIDPSSESSLEARTRQLFYTALDSSAGEALFSTALEATPGCEQSMGTVACEQSVGSVACDQRMGSVAPVACDLACDQSMGSVAPVACDQSMGSVACDQSMGSVAPVACDQSVGSVAPVACEQSIGSVACDQSMGSVGCDQSMGSVACDQSMGSVACDQSMGSVACDQSMGSVAPVACDQSMDYVSMSSVACDQSMSSVACDQSMGSVACDQSMGSVACDQSMGSVACDQSMGSVAPVACDQSMGSVACDQSMAPVACDQSVEGYQDRTSEVGSHEAQPEEGVGMEVVSPPGSQSEVHCDVDITPPDRIPPQTISSSDQISSHWNETISNDGKKADHPTMETSSSDFVAMARDGSTDSLMRSALLSSSVEGVSLAPLESLKPNRAGLGDLSSDSSQECWCHANVFAQAYRNRAAEPSFNWSLTFGAMDVPDIAVPGNEVLANEVLSNEVVANEVLSNEVLANEVLGNEVCQAFLTARSSHEEADFKALPRAGSDEPALLWDETARSLRELTYDGSEPLALASESCVSSSDTYRRPEVPPVRLEACVKDFSDLAPRSPVLFQLSASGGLPAEVSCQGDDTVFESTTNSQILVNSLQGTVIVVSQGLQPRFDDALDVIKLVELAPFEGVQLLTDQGPVLVVNRKSQIPPAYLGQAHDALELSETEPQEEVTGLPVVSANSLNSEPVAALPAAPAPRVPAESLGELMSVKERDLLRRIVHKILES